ncbi:hypothetical protein GMNKNHGO_00033 [Enterococcus phage vB_Efa29212_3e]|uniref:Calcineurin-like phosphoesterase domain-containing protein n=1 Tax=Enterococcus phage vB_Efa29212_3e TaxID=2982224 RepID=A0A978AC46_9CAUD|nr:hypothetical protein GMNKNHGO_00033 [Enterococcus phage vB_Efa29212_3e]
MAGKITLEAVRKVLLQDDKSSFDVLSSYVVENQAVLARNREFGKLQREGAYLDHLISGLKTYLLAELKDMSSLKYISKNLKAPKVSSDRELILCLSDWHIGAFVNNIDTGGYNFEIFKERLEKLLEEVFQVAMEQDIKKIHVYHIGDIIEHINMRNVNQAFEAEFPATEQIAKGIRVIADTLNLLAKAEFEVSFGMVGGNHDRFQGNKNDKIHNDNVAYLVVDQLHFLQELGALNKDIKLVDNRSDVYSFKDTVAGKRIKVTHGDTEGKKVDVKIPKHIKDEVIDYLIMGHIHTTRIIQEDFSRFHVYVGSPMGANNYSAENNLPTTSPAQLIMVLDPERDTPQFMPVFL